MMAVPRRNGSSTVYSKNKAERKNKLRLRPLAMRQAALLEHESGGRAQMIADRWI
jgi:hypothetical protein